MTFFMPRGQKLKSIERHARIRNLLLSATTLAALCLAGCSGGGGSSTTPTEPQAATPQFSLASGSYTTLQSVTISDATAGVAIYYTLDGTTPTSNSSVYGTPIPVAMSTTIKAFAMATGYTDSAVGSAAYTINFPAAPTMTPVADIHQGFIYQIVTDRFFNGDTSNDNPPQSAGMFDANGFTNPSDWQQYWGGDLAGITQKMQYLQSLGVAAIWISPPVDNVNLPDSSGHAPYHGYWPRDMMRIEEHFGDTDNTWSAFDNLVAAAHAAKIKVIVDFVGNHTNDIGTGEDGALYNNGVKVTDYSSDTGATTYYHHNQNISNYEDRYQLQYWTLSGLADLAQENPYVDQYLKAAVEQFLDHGADGFRLDALKHMNWGWEYSLENTVANWSGSANLPSATSRPFLFGEWLEGSGDSLYPDSVKHANNSGINLLDYPLYYQISSVFGTDGSFYNIDNEINLEDNTAASGSAQSFAQPNDLVTFFDNHDNPRIQSMGADAMEVKMATAFVMTCRGVPVLYYGDEQYLHNDTDSGNDPYDRNAMTSFSANDATLLIQYLAALRSSNPAVAYGSFTQRWLTNDTYIYERQLGTNVVLVAFNKNPSSDQAITGLFTYLPPGSYTDYLAGTMGGSGITVTGTAGANNPVTNFTLPHRTVAIWVSNGAASPGLGSITPRVANAGVPVTLSGSGLGATAGLVVFSQGGNNFSATVTNWTDSQITVVVPALSAGPGTVAVSQGGNTSNAIPFTASSGVLVPVVFSLTGFPSLSTTDQLFLSGNIAELGNWSTAWTQAIGPAPLPTATNALVTASLPLSTGVQFKFFILHADGSVTWENGANHIYTVPANGVGNVTVAWQN